MPKLEGRIFDSTTGELVEARVQIQDPTGHNIGPQGVLWKVGPGEPFFYSSGEFSVQATRGYYRVLVERGTEYRPWQTTVEVTSARTETVDVSLERWTDLGTLGWHPGNTHIHYDENETRPDERLRHDPRVEDLRMTAVSILKRWDLEYATNKYPAGILTEFTDTHYLVQCGEETRHNAGGAHEIGYGHVMLLNLRNYVEPISRGLLVDAFDPDYPPLIYACDDARRQGGLVIWCHNGRGMEAPVAAALKRLDAMNLFDPYWWDIEYDLWYRMLNTGARLPASTGSDWFVSSANRVYVDTGGAFDYGAWLEGMRSGRTFITNGPALFIEVDGQPPGATVHAKPGEDITVNIRWKSHYPIERIELINDGKVVKSYVPKVEETEGSLEYELSVHADGWIAARLGSTFRDSFAQPVWAHTSPVYVDVGGVKSAVRMEAAAILVNEIETSMDWVRSKGRFYSDSQRNEIIDLFLQAQELYRGVAG